MTEYLVKSAEHSRFFKASRPEVAAKRFLNYLRRMTKERPEKLEIQWQYNGKQLIADADVEWYIGKLENSPFEGPVGEWWKLKSVDETGVGNALKFVKTLLEREGPVGEWWKLKSVVVR